MEQYESEWKVGLLCASCHGELSKSVIMSTWASDRKCPHCKADNQKTYGCLDHYVCPYKIVYHATPWWKAWWHVKTTKVWAVVTPGRSPDYRNLYKKILEQNTQIKPFEE